MGNSGSHNFSVITDYQLFKYTKRTLYNIIYLDILVMACIVVLSCSCASVVGTILDVIIGVPSVVINYFILNPFVAHGGYLHVTKASLRWDNCFWSSSGLV